MLAATVLWTVLAWPGLVMGQSPPSSGGSMVGEVSPEEGSGYGPERRVLLLYSEPRLQAGLTRLDQALRSTLESKVRVRFYTEYLDLNLFNGAAPLRELHQLLRRKYEQPRDIDVIVAAGSRALRIALHNRADLFSSAPVVFAAVDRAAAADLSLDADVTGTWLHQGWTDTLDLARRLQPGARRALVVTGASPVDRVWDRAARAQLVAYAGTMEIGYLSGPRLEDVLKEVATLPAQTLVLVGPFSRDATRRDFTTPEVTKRIAAASIAPVYGLTETSVGTGIVGGYVESFEAHGRMAAGLALRVLAGERPAPTEGGTSVPTFDARQVKRWRINPRHLPAGSVILFQEPSVWAQYGWYIFGGISVLILQTGLIGGLLAQRHKRRRAQMILAERVRFETLLSDLSAMFAVGPAGDVDRQIKTGLDRIVESLGLDEAFVWVLRDGTDEAWLTHAGTRTGASAAPAVIRESQAPWIFSQLRQGQIVRMPNPGDPSDRTPADPTVPRLGMSSATVVPLIAGGALVGCLSVGTVREGRPWPDELLPRLRLLADVLANALARQRAEHAERKSEEHIQDLAGRLMKAQEVERRRIARELHDGVNQELAGMAIALSVLGGHLAAGAPAGVRAEVARLQEQAAELAEAIRHLSHEIHPGVLEHVGVAAALRGYCREFEREHGLKVTFRADDDLGSVPADVGLCLYRVTQEALRNVAKHAAAHSVWVAMRRDGADVALTIGDDGRGFDLAAVRGRNGLGLISLDERVRLAKGRFTIDAQPRRGTELRIVVPLFEARDAPRDRAAG